MEKLENRIGKAFGYPELLPGAHDPKTLHSVDISSKCASCQPGQEVLLDLSMIGSQPYVAIITKSGKTAGIIVFMVADLKGYASSPDANSFQCTAHCLGLKPDYLSSLIDEQWQSITAS